MFGRSDELNDLTEEVSQENGASNKMINSGNSINVGLY